MEQIKEKVRDFKKLFTEIKKLKLLTSSEKDILEKTESLSRAHQFFGGSAEEEKFLVPICFIGVKKCGKSTLANLFISELSGEFTETEGEDDDDENVVEVKTKKKGIDFEMFPVDDQVCTNIPIEEVHSKDKKTYTFHFVRGDKMELYERELRNKEGDHGEQIKNSILSLLLRNTNGKKVAIKEIDLKHLKGNVVREKRRLDQFREAHFLTKFEHPNIIKAYFAYLDERPKDSTYLVIVEELMETDFEKVFTNYRVDLPARLDYLIDMAEGLKFLHNYGLYHRDFKPGNVLCKGKRAKIADLGCTKSSDLIVQKTEYVGTECYNDFRVTKAEKGYSLEIDAFSFGLVMIDMWEQKRFIHSPYFNEENYEYIRKYYVNGNYSYLKMKKKDKRLVGGSLFKEYSGHPPNVKLKYQKLTKDCLTLFHEMRPSFEDIVDRLKEMKGLLMIG